MPREQLRHDIPDEWAENMKHGRCWCGKNHSEFEKRMKFFCCHDHANQYNQRVTTWSAFKEDFLAENGKKCVKCGITDKKFEETEKQREKDWWLAQAAKYPEELKMARSFMILELEKEFQRILNDEYVMVHMPWQISRDADMPHFHFQREHFYIEVDHKIAVSLGGDMWDKANLQALCTPCHQEKTKLDMQKLRIKKKSGAPT